MQFNVCSVLSYIAAKIDLLDLSRIERYQQELCDEENPIHKPLEAQELHHVWQRGNRRCPLPPTHSDRHKAQLSATRQKQRRQVFRKTYKSYFTQSNDTRL